MNVFDIGVLRTRGLSDTALFPDQTLIDTEKRVWELIELICNQFFEKRTFNSVDGDYSPIRLDGTGRSMLYLPFPVVTLDELTVDSTAVSLTDLVIYDRLLPNLDDRKNPKIKHTNGTFSYGNLNITLSGTFGFVNSLGFPPTPLVDAAMKILMLELQPLAGAPGWNGGPIRGSIISETSDKYMYKKDNGEIITGFTGVPDIDKCLFLFRRDSTSLLGRVI